MKISAKLIRKFSVIALITVNALLTTLLYAPPKYDTYKMPYRGQLNTMSISFPIAHLEDCLGVHKNTISVLQGLMLKNDWETNVRNSFIRKLNQHIIDDQTASDTPTRLLVKNLYVGMAKELNQDHKPCIDFIIQYPQGWRTDARPNELLSADLRFGALIERSVFTPRKALFNRALCETLSETLSSVTGQPCELQWFLEGRLFATVDPKTAAISLDLLPPKLETTSGPRPPERTIHAHAQASALDNNVDELACATSIAINGSRKRSDAK